MTMPRLADMRTHRSSRVLEHSARASSGQTARPARAAEGQIAAPLAVWGRLLGSQPSHGPWTARGFRPAIHAGLRR